MNVDYYLVSADRRDRRLMPKRVYVMGRDPAADITLQDALISRRHGELHWDNEGGWVLVDLNSRNGIMLNGERVIGRKPLKDGDQIQLGGQVLNYYLVPPNSDLGAISRQAPEISSQVTMAPGVSFNQMATAGATFSGSIANGLLELMQFFTMTGKSGRLDLSDKPGCAVWFVDGVPRHARDASGEEGFEALLRLSSDHGDTFAFFADEFPPGDPSIEGGADGIMMEIARQMDEAGR